MRGKKPYFITTAIAYTSRKPHMGNSYEIVLTDAAARLKRMQGYDVFFLTGTDEHGKKIEDYAKAAQISPREYVDKVTGEIRGVCDCLGTSQDYFIRTTDEGHEKIVQKIFQKLYDQGDIYKSEYEGWYCVACESFYTETQLHEGACPDCGGEVTKTKEEAYFLKLSKYQKRLEEYIEQNPGFIFPESRKKEMVNNFLKPGLQDLCVSRSSFSWGVPVPFDPKHVIYVWIDALSNYITALGYDPDGSSENFEKYWPADAHIIGKDILRFHTIYWPIMLMALGLPQPKSIFGHPWFLFGKEKMSKSKGNIIYADDLAQLIGRDAVRYYLLSEMPYNQDGSITYETIFDRYNSDLANTLGNLVNRTIAMIHKYFGGVLPADQEKEPLDEEIAEGALSCVQKVQEKMGSFHCADALDEIMSFARRCNKYIDETLPWALAKEEAKKPRLAGVLACLAEAIRVLGVILTPFLPDTAGKILDQLQCPEDLRTLESATFASAGDFGRLPAGISMGEAAPLFGRLDKEKLMAEIKQAQEEAAKAAGSLQEIQKAASGDSSEEKAPEVTIEDFAKLELRVAEVKSCEKVPKSDKLYCLQLDDGMGGRQVVSGIAKWYTPEELVGKKVVVVANLKPVKLRGVLSQGMIMAADDEDGGARVLFPDASLPNGAKVR